MALLAQVVAVYMPLVVPDVCLDLVSKESKTGEKEREKSIRDTCMFAFSELFVYLFIS